MLLYKKLLLMTFGTTLVLQFPFLIFYLFFVFYEQTKHKTN